MADWPEEARMAAIKAIDGRTGPHLQITAPLAMYVATDILNAAAPLIATAERDRAEAAEARLGEIRQAIAAYFTVHGNSSAPFLQSARDLGGELLRICDGEGP